MCLRLSPLKHALLRSEYSLTSAPPGTCLAPNFLVTASITCLAVTARCPPIKVAVPITQNFHSGSSTTTRSAISWMGSLGGESRKAGVGGKLCRMQRNHDIHPSSAARVNPWTTLP
jgi:hypothetical protein